MYGRRGGGRGRKQFHGGRHAPAAGRTGSHWPAQRVQGDWKNLEDVFRRIDGRSYPAYKDLYGEWSFPEFSLVFDQIQGDAYASPSKIRVKVPWDVVRYPEELWKMSKVRRVALCDYLVRSFQCAVRSSKGDVRAQAGGWRGEKGGEMNIQDVGQYVMERSSVTIDRESGMLEARFTVGLPAKGRNVLGRWASMIFVDNLPRYVSEGLKYSSLDSASVYRHVLTVEDADALRKGLKDKNLIAFVSNGSILPRKSGNSDEPMDDQSVVPFTSPKELLVEMQTPNNGAIVGMGIPKGITLIVGGGFHGKSTLLEALQTGIYNKIPGDGREFVVADDSCAKIRAEDGRRVECVDISPFVGTLPGGKSTTCFSSTDSSGSTSQASSIQESLENGSKVLLVDEDTSATNFMVRDARMQELIAKDLEPITPFLQRVRALRNSGISSILVVGGTGEYFSVADRVIAMKNYCASDVTLEAKSIAEKYHQAAISSGVSMNVYHDEEGTKYFPIKSRMLVDNGLQNERPKCKVQSLHSVQLDHEILDLIGLEQLAEEGQTRAIACAINLLSKRMHGPWRGKPFAEALKLLNDEIEHRGLDVLTEDVVHGSLSRPRIHEVAAACNRLRTATFRQHGDEALVL